MITDLQAEKTALQQDQAQALVVLEKKVDALVITVDTINKVVQELRIKDLARDVQK